MPSPTVTIQLLSDDSIPVPIASAVVQIYDNSAVFQTSGVTASDGTVSVILADGNYQIYLFKAGVSFLPSQPQIIQVTGSNPNLFNVICHVKTLPESVDPLRCTVSGYILGADGSKSEKTRLVFELQKELMVLSENIIALDSRTETASDDTGYFEFELLRDTKYNAYFVFPQDILGTQPGQLQIQTPNAASVKLFNLLFPLPLSLSFSQGSITVPRGAQDESVTVSVTFSDSTIRGVVSTAWAGVIVSNPDNTIADVSISDTTLIITPLKPGTIVVTTTRQMGSSALFNPLPDFTSGSISITVT